MIQERIRFRSPARWRTVLNSIRFSTVATVVLLVLSKIAVVAAVAAENDVPITSPSAEQTNVGASHNTSGESSSSAAATSADFTIGRSQIRQLFRGIAGVPMWAMVGCSITLVMFVIDRLSALRKSRVVPVPFVTRINDSLQRPNLDEATFRKLLEICRGHGSTIASFLTVILEHRGRPTAEIKTAVEDHSVFEIYKLKKYTRAIGALANLAPLLGLFGTVIGMIDAFRSLSQLQAGVGKSEMLAQGISLALIATASGLGIAIVASAFYYFLQGMVEQRIHELDTLMHQTITLVAVDKRPSDVQ